ncbi:MAG: PLP-dependent aminotransferase family protein [Firmicutes bacterium]|nr:PLP-dependent aminotransferase family protein [Bacillota bacterium]
MNDLTIQLTDNAGKCLYQQIYEHIRDEIRTGKLRKGEKLPSTRSLAEYLQVARSTVDFAYGQLTAEGYIEARPCRGYFVSQVEDLFHLSNGVEASTTSGTGRNCEPVKSEKISLMEGMQEQAEGKTEVLYDFSPHAISLKDFPYATWKKITKNILVDANSEMFALGDAQGDRELRETISRYLHSSRGVNCAPEQVIIGAGTDYLFMLLEKILGRHVPIAMEDPSYKRAYRVFQSFAYEIEAIPVDENGMDVEKLRNTKARVAYVMPSHQYPTGVVMPIGRRLELLKWADEDEDRYLIEDDYDSEFRYKGKPIPSLQASDREGKVIYMGTFSKSIAPAIRVGYMVLPLKLLEVYRKNCGFYACTVSRIDQRILNEFIKNGYFERYLNKMRKGYRERHDFLLNQLESFKKGFRISGENAGLHILLTSRKHIPEEELLKAAAEKGVRLYGISDACMEQRQQGTTVFEGTVLLGYGALEKQELFQGVQKLKEAWSTYL